MQMSFLTQNVKIHPNGLISSFFWVILIDIERGNWWSKQPPYERLPPKCRWGTVNPDHFFPPNLRPVWICCPAFRLICLGISVLYTGSCLVANPQDPHLILFYVCYSLITPNKCVTGSQLELCTCFYFYVLSERLHTTCTNGHTGPGPGIHARHY